MDRIQDSGSYDCSSILHGGTKKGDSASPFFIYGLLDVRDEDSDYAEDVDDIGIFEIEIREVLLVFCYECQACAIVDQSSEEHSA